MMPAAIYVLCALTSICCAGLLLRSYQRVRLRLMLWMALCFSGLALNNVLLVVDLVVFPTTVDLSIWRSGIALASLIVLLASLTWESN